MEEARIAEVQWKMTGQAQQSIGKREEVPAYVGKWESTMGYLD